MSPFIRKSRRGWRRECAADKTGFMRCFQSPDRAHEKTAKA
ncbi:hypothetical protein PAMC26510_02095 [Caballeronia sordidicola]|uniref:Uncharacterized protein n=1 Tax=Caballeronia sordidicola TaxID=196367 RepID=A0A242NB60_CABSO|nr:hypothetical protein PAMC26510_02095 [Caballeronia sordidicola]